MALKTGKYDITTIAVTMVVLYVGALLSGFIVPYIPTWSGWMQGFIVAIFQALILSFVGLLSGKMSIWNLMITAVIIVVGGLIGGAIGGYLGFSGLWLTIVLLAVQTFMLIATGFIGKKKAKL